MLLKNKKKDTRQIGRELEVGHSRGKSLCARLGDCCPQVSGNRDPRQIPVVCLTAPMEWALGDWEARM